MNTRDSIPGFFFVGMSILVLVALIGIPMGSLSAPGMSFFPVVLCALILLLSMILIGRAFKTKITRQAVYPGKYWKKLIPVVAALIAYTFLFDPVGYVVCTTLILILIAKLADCSWKLSALISILCTVVSYIVFSWYLHIPLPEGIIPF